MSAPEKKDGRRRKDYEPEPHRMLPQAPDAERGVLSSMMIGGADVIEQVAAKITADHFHVPAHELIFQFICQLHKARLPTDFITLTQALRDANQIDQVGGAAYVTELFTYLPTAANCGYYAEIMREKYQLRQIIRIATEFAGRAYDEQDDLPKLVEEFQARAIEIGMDSEDAAALRPISQAEVMEELQSIEARYHNRGQPMGIPSGFHDFDRMTDGFLKPQVYVIGGRPAMGKTSIGMNFAEHIAVTAGAENRTTAIFSVEMTRKQLIRRMVMNLASLSLKRLRDGFLREADFPRLAEAAKKIIAGKIILDGTSGLTIAQFRSRARRAVLRDKAELIIIDHLHKMKGVSKRGGENRSLELAEIMQGITETAKQLDVPVIVLAQLNRGAADKGPIKPPSMADLEWSSVIEQEAHLVGLLHRPDYYAKTDADKEKIAEKYDMTVEQLATYAELLIDKHRDGPVGTVKLKFLGEFTRFENQTGKLFSNNPGEQQEMST